jgi:hypothetical protein
MQSEHVYVASRVDTVARHVKHSFPDPVPVLRRMEDTADRGQMQWLNGELHRPAATGIRFLFCLEPCPLPLVGFDVPRSTVNRLGKLALAAFPTTTISGVFPPMAAAPAKVDFDRSCGS